MMPMNGMMPMGGMQPGMMMQPMGMMMQPMGMGMMQPMGMGMGGQMMMQMQPMGMMPMAGNTGMGNGGMPASGGTNVANSGDAVGDNAGTTPTPDVAATEGKSSGSVPAKSSRQSRRSAEESENLADIEVGTLILVKYQHPSL